MEECAVIKLFDREYPLLPVEKFRSKHTRGKYDPEGDIKVLAELEARRAFQITWHEVGHALQDFYATYLIHEALKDTEEHLCKTIFEYGVPNLLMRNPCLRSVQSFTKVWSPEQ